MLNFSNLRKLGINTTILATSISLIACGGGGGGYYGESNSGSTTPNTGDNNTENNNADIPANISIKVKDQNDKELINALDNSVIKVEVHVVNADKGSLANQEVTLSINDTNAIGATTMLSKVQSDANGIATFTVQIPTIQLDKAQLGLTATVSGTSIKQVQTLQIVKSSTIVSDYNLIVPQGLKAVLPKGKTGEFEVIVTDNHGAVKSGQTVQIELPEQLKGKVLLTKGASITTNADGKAIFDIEANPELKQSDINGLINQSFEIKFRLIDENKAEKIETSSLTFSDVSEVVNSLEVIKPDNAVSALGGKATIRVYAKNSSGHVLANTKVQLSSNASLYGATLDKLEATTNSAGYAEFELTVNSSYPIALSQQGIELKATYPGSDKVHGTATVQVITSDDSSQDEKAIQRLEIGSSYKINAKDDQVEIRVKAIANNGYAATSGSVTLSMNDEASSRGVKFVGSSNGITFDSNATQKVDENGFVTFLIQTPTQITQDAIKALVTSGIVANFETNNKVKSSIKIEVEDEIKSVQPVSYLMIDPINQKFSLLENQEIKIKVKAIGQNGSPLKNELIKIETQLSSAELSAFNLSISGNNELKTDVNGYVEFVYHYKVNSNSEKLPKSIQFKATALSNSKTQNIDVIFNNPSEVIGLDYFKVEHSGSANISVGTQTRVKVNAEAFGINGSQLKDQVISIGIDNTAADNGVSFNSSTSLKTDANGKAYFELLIDAENVNELNALLSNGVTVALVSNRADGTKYTITRNITLLQSSFVDTSVSKIDYLLVSPLAKINYNTESQKIEIEVKAIDLNGSPLANEKVAIKSTLTNQQMGAIFLSLVNSNEQTTDSKGIAKFEYEYKYADTNAQKALLTKGVELKVSPSNSLANDPRIQSVFLNFKDPSLEYIIDLNYLSIENTVGSQAIDLNQSQIVDVQVKAVGTDGKVLVGKDLSIAIENTVLNKGVTFVGNTTLKTDQDGVATFKLNVNAKNIEEFNNLLQSGLNITVSSLTNSSSRIEAKRKIELVDKALVNQLAILEIDDSNLAKVLNYTSNQTIEVKVKALSKDRKALAGHKVSLSHVLPNLGTGVPLNQLGLTLNEKDVTTDANGIATFTYKYVFKNTPEQIELVKQGVRVVATSIVAATTMTAEKTLSAVTQINFSAAQVLDYFNLNLSSSFEEISLEQSKSITVTVDAFDRSGAPLVHQWVKVNLNEAALSNGITFGTPSAVMTNEHGKATFTVNIAPKNETQLTNLDANDLNITVTSQRLDGTEYTSNRRVELTKPEVKELDLADLSVKYIVDGKDTDLASISVLGGEVDIKVVAIDKDAKPIANTPLALALALAGITSSRVSISDTTLKTNSKGEATFKVKVSEGIYDESLIKNGIVFAVVGTNLNNGDRIQQTKSVQVTIPQNSQDLRLTSDLSEINPGQSGNILIAVKDEIGSSQSGYPVYLSLDNSSIAAGIKLSHEMAMSLANQTTSVSLVVPKEVPSTLNKITITGLVRDAMGRTIKKNLILDLTRAVNPNHLIIMNSKDNLSVDGDRSIVTVALLDRNNQPVRNQAVTLAANNAATLIIGTPGGGNSTNTSSSQTVVTDSNGHAFFSVSIDEKTVDGDLLIASGIELTATHTDEKGALTSQISRMKAYRPAPPTASQPEPARHSVRVAAAKPTLNVRNDTTDVMVTLVDKNGGGVANQYVELAIENNLNNGAIIVGASGLTTDENGQAVFKVKVDEASRSRNYSADMFIEDNLRFTATFKETGYLDADQITLVDIIQSVIANPVASIVIGVNPTSIATSSDGVYYTRNLSVSVVDFDGKPLSNQSVNMEIAPTFYTKGQYRWALAPISGSTKPQMQWVNAGDSYFDLSNPNIYLTEDGFPMDNNGTISDLRDDRLATAMINPQIECRADADGKAVSNTQVTNVPVKVPTFLGQGATATYITDSEGKFDFVIRYPKIYAQWLNVQISASSQIASLPSRTFYDLGLPALTNDYSSNGTFAPNLNSPYGTNTISCP